MVLGILGVLIATVLPGMVAGIRAGDLARTNTQARGLAQAELERMRNLPFHLARDAGEFIDVLDHYFPDRTKPTGAVTCGSAERWTVPATSWSGYVEPGDTRCDWEPASGAFYRQVRPAAAGAANPDTTDFVVVTDTRFLTDATPASVVAPPAHYSHAFTGRDTPPASQLGVTVTVFPRNGSTRAPVTSATQIGRQSISPPRAGSTVSVTTLEVGTTTVDGLPLSLSAGVLDLSTSLTGSSEAQGVLSATLTGLGTGQQAAGVALALIDLEHGRLPFALTGVAAVAVVGLLALDQARGAAVSVSSLAVAVAAWACVYAGCWALTRGRGMGLGDVALAPVLGLALGGLGVGSALVGLGAGFVLGGLVAGVLLATGRVARGDRVPHGPFMLVGAGVGLFAGEPVAAAYLRLTGLA